VYPDPSLYASPSMVAQHDSISDSDDSDGPPPRSKRRPATPNGAWAHGDADAHAPRIDDDAGRGRRPWAPAGSPQAWRGVTAMDPPPRPSRAWADVQPRVNLKRPHELPPAAAAAAFRRSVSPGHRSLSPERAAAGSREGPGLRLSFRGRPLNKTRRVRAG
jgi:hypothetical protein